ncbi:FAD-dependent oxidoreductase [Sphingomonas hylomeconis]|uniref:FAD-dependent oxidoreductase n=1 Tax=Sphingomonas hylomeconis TaxID=1395958 RepID=A0ABV7SQE0_9SPHN|nr:FAD-dependent oxidoreductase [Sphingomonas hylomeconis]
MRNLNILVIGGGIGGLTAAIALRRDGHAVTVIEQNPNWSVYGVGIIQQSNVIRAMSDLGLIDSYLGAAYGFDFVEIFTPTGVKVARVPSPNLVEGYPANVGIARPALHKVLVDRVLADGVEVKLGVTARQIDDLGDRVRVTLSDDGVQDFDIVVGADGVYSQTRATFFPDAPLPAYTGQAVWRYNLPRPADLDALQAYNGPIGIGLVPMSADQMYIFVTTPEPGNTRYARDGLAARMRDKLENAPPAVRALAAGITDDQGVVYRPLETVIMEGPWHKGRVVMLGDAIHATTPHLGQGAGMAIEDSIVLAEELSRHDTPDAAFTAYRERRYDRCAYIVQSSLAICRGQLGLSEPVDNAVATREMFAAVSQPI